MGRMALLGLGALVCASFAACGGATDTQLFDDAGQPINDATTVEDTGTKSDGGTGTDATTQDAVVIDAVTVDVPIGPQDSKIHCGTTTCSAQTQICCATFGQTTTYACVSSPSDCQGQSQTPIGCTSHDNCASQGQPNDICCASGQGPINPNPNCQGFSTVAQVQCQSSCDPNQGEFEVGCSVQTQNCSDTTATCITSKCTLPGITICQ
jgi:hypothetical protein